MGDDWPGMRENVQLSELESIPAPAMIYRSMIWPALDWEAPYANEQIRDISIILITDSR